MSGHTGGVNSVVFSKDGQQIISGSDDHTIRVWNVTTGTMEGVPLTGHTDWVNSVAFSQDGQQIISGSCDGTICLWNAITVEIDAKTLYLYFVIFCLFQNNST